MRILHFPFRSLTHRFFGATAWVVTLAWLLLGVAAHAQVGSGRPVDFVPVQLDVQVEPRTLTPYFLLVNGDYLYSTAWTNSEGCVTITELSDPLHPKVVGLHSFGRDGPIGGLVFVENLLYVSGTNLSVLDVSTPAEPRVVTSLPPAKPAHHFALRDSLLYVAELGGMEIFSVSDPTTPVSLSTLDLDGTLRFNIALHGSVAFVSGGTNLHVIDVANPLQPKLKKSISLAGSSFPSVRDMEIYADKLYLAAWHQGLVIFDISDPLEPIRLESPSLAEYNSLHDHRTVTALQRRGDLLFGATSWGGVIAFDLRNPSTPTISGHLLENFHYGGVIQGLALYKERVISLQEFDLASLQVLDVFESEFAPIATHHSPGPRVSSAVALTEETIAFAGRSIFSAPLALFPPLNLISNMALSLSSQTATMIVASNKLFTLHGTDLFVHDFQPDASLTLAATFNTRSLGNIDRLAVINPGYLLRSGWGITVYNPVAPGGPEQIAYHTNFARVVDVAAVESLAALGTPSGAILLDLSDPLHPVELSTISPLTNSLSVAMEKNLLAVAHTTNRLSVYDVSSPRNPSLVAHTRIRSSPRQMLLSEGQLFISYLLNGFEVFDLRSKNLDRIGGDSANFVQDIAINKRYLLVGTGNRVHLFERPPPLPPRLINPLFSPSEFSFELNKPIDAPLILQESSDLLLWHEHSTIIPGAGPIHIPALNPASHGRYFRIKKD